MVELTDRTHKKIKDTHVTLTSDGRIHVYFAPHAHVTLDRDDLEGTGEAQAVGLYSQAVKKGAEKLKAGLSGDITEQDIGAAYTTEHEARKESENGPVAEPEPKEVG